MAFKKTLVQRLFNLSRFSTPSLYQKPNPTRTVNSSRVNRIHQQSTGESEMRLFPMTCKGLAETLRDIDITKRCINLDGMVAYETRKEVGVEELTVNEVRKVLRATQVEIIREKLISVGKDWVEFKEFVEIVVEFCGGNREHGLEFVKVLDDCGSVIVLGNFVCLRPHKEIRTMVAKAIYSLVTPPVSANPNDPRRKELEQMEEQKAEIDLKAEALVRRELWAGLGYMVVQTVGFMRLTFWELSWDVMEPICFYVTSIYFMLGYTFFLRTSKEPSFEGFFKSRFNAKQKRIMEAREFDLNRYNELRKVFYPHPSSFSSSLDDTMLMKFNHLKVN